MDSSTFVPLRLPNQSLIRFEAAAWKRHGDRDVALNKFEKPLAKREIDGALQPQARDSCHYDPSGGWC
jgi:hypothetical protein